MKSILISQPRFVQHSKSAPYLAGAHGIDLTYELLPFDFHRACHRGLVWRSFQQTCFVYARHRQSTLQEDQQPISPQIAIA